MSDQPDPVHARSSSPGAPSPVRPDSRPDTPLRLALHASVLGTVVAAALGALVAAVGVLQPPQLRACGMGLLTAAATTGLGNLVLATTMLDRRPASATALTRALFADLFLHVVVGGGSAAVLFLLRTKFLAAATFPLAFATSVIVLRVTSAVVLARALKSAAARRAAAENSAPAPQRPSNKGPSNKRPSNKRPESSEFV